MILTEAHPETMAVVVADGEGNSAVVARLALRTGRLRGWHHGAFAGVAALSGYCWFGADMAGLVALAYRAHFTRVRLPRKLQIYSGLQLWMSPRLVVVSHGFWRRVCLYRDELAPRDFVRLRRLLKRAAASSKRQPLTLPDFALV